MFYTSFYVPVVSGEVKLAFRVGGQATLMEVSACSVNARAARLGVKVNELPVLEGVTIGKKGAPEVFGRPAFLDKQPHHVKKGDLVDVTLKGGEEKAPVEGVTVVLTFA